MTILNSIILGIVEGFTEFLPISSTAHLILSSKLLGIATSDFLKSFEIIIQLGAIGSVVFLYFKTFLKNWGLNAKVIIAFIPTAIFGLVFYSLIKNTFITNLMVSVWALLLGGIFIIFFENKHKEKENHISNLDAITHSKAFLIGCCQALSIIPGISRAGATIIGGMAIGVKRTIIVEFSFLLAVPTMLAATGLDLIKNYSLFSSSDWKILIIGFVISFIIATASIKFLLNYIKSNNFISFGMYRIAIAILFWLSL